MLRKARILTVFLSGSAAAAMAQSGPPVRLLEPGRQIRLSAAGEDALRYQWYRNGQPIAGATAIIYVVNEPGAYTVVAYNSRDGCASDPSDPVVITGPPVTGPGATDMSISKTADARQALAGSDLSYLLTITNNGPATATGIIVKDALPAGLELDRLLPPAKGSAMYEQSTRTVIWTIQKLEMHDHATLTIITKAPKGGDIENTATVSASEPDSVLANNRAAHLLRVMPLFIPNAFTANGDGRNDKFRIIGLERYPDNELTVFNRWGMWCLRKRTTSNDGMRRGRRRVLMFMCCVYGMRRVSGRYLKGISSCYVKICQFIFNVL